MIYFDRLLRVIRQSSTNHVWLCDQPFVISTDLKWNYYQNKGGDKNYSQHKLEFFQLLGYFINKHFEESNI